MFAVLEQELRRQQREVAAQMSSARRDGDLYLMEALSARLDDLARVARSHGLRLALVR